MLKLNKLSSLVKKRKRVGRGGSRGSTSGRGHKGQKARSGGGVGPVREGGQMPLVRRLPKRGFNNARFRKSFAIINLEYLNTAFQEGQEITKEILVKKGVIARDELVKILGNGTLEKKLIIYADACSKSAENAIKGKGGEIHLTQEI